MLWRKPYHVSPKRYQRTRYMELNGAFQHESLVVTNLNWVMKSLRKKCVGTTKQTFFSVAFSNFRSRWEPDISTSLKVPSKFWLLGTSPSCTPKGGTLGEDNTALPGTGMFLSSGMWRREATAEVGVAMKRSTFFDDPNSICSQSSRRMYSKSETCWTPDLNWNLYFSDAVRRTWLIFQSYEGMPQLAEESE